MSAGLAGATVVVTRASHQSAAMTEMLASRGALVVELPLIAVADPDDGGKRRDEVLGTLGRFEWVVVTSPNGAAVLADRLGPDAARGGSPKIAVVGRATEAALGRGAALVAEPAQASSLVEAFPRGSGRVLVVKGDLAGETVAHGLEERGWSVTELVAYRTVSVRPDPTMTAAALGADVLMLASGSAARSWHETFGTRTPPVVVCIGPSTAQVAHSLGIEVSATAAHHSIEEMVLCAERILSHR